LKNIVRTLSVAGAVTVFCSAGVIAAESTAASDTLQEIVITAAKRSSTVQDTPICVTAVSGDDAIAIESRVNNPYGNVIAVRAAEKDRPLFKALIAAYQNDEIRRFILNQFDGAVLRVF
jgi:hypothetical protein